MEVFGWIATIILYLLALIFIVVELGPTIHANIISWKIRKERALEEKEMDFKFKQEMKDLERKAERDAFLQKKGIIPSSNSSTRNEVENFKTKESSPDEVFQEKIREDAINYYKGIKESSDPLNEEIETPKKIIVKDEDLLQTLDMEGYEDLMPTKSKRVKALKK